MAAAVVLNGGFDSDTIWSKGALWTIATGVATAATANTDIQQTLPDLAPGVNYRVTYTVSFTAGSVTAKLGGTAGTTRSSSGTFSETITAGANGLIAFTAAVFVGSIDDVSIRRVGSVFTRTHMRR